jgi:hypothetical protein
MVRNDKREHDNTNKKPGLSMRFFVYVNHKLPLPTCITEILNTTSTFYNIIDLVAGDVPLSHSIEKTYLTDPPFNLIVIKIGAKTLYEMEDGKGLFAELMKNRLNGNFVI